MTNKFKYLCVSRTDLGGGLKGLGRLGPYKKKGISPKQTHVNSQSKTQQILFPIKKKKKKTNGVLYHLSLLIDKFILMILHIFLN